MLLCAAVAAAGIGGVAHAVPINYEGLLVAFEASTDSISNTGSYDSASSDVSDYWGFIPQTSLPLWDIAVFRLEAAFDPALWVFEGFFDDTTDFSGGFSSEIDQGDPGFLELSDDEIPREGPFGDPRALLDLQVGTFYTFIVTNFSSGPDDGDGVFPYQIRVTAIPVPAALPLLVTAFGLMGYLGYRRSV